jgi:hypothetical protein
MARLSPRAAPSALPVKRPNPYWDAVVEHVRPSEFPWEGGLEVLPLGYFPGGSEDQPDRHALVAQYAWTITDPVSVAFVARWAGGRMVDPMAGTGYWGYVLGFLGTDVASYDIAPPQENGWHKNAVQHAPVDAVNHGAEVVGLHPDRTLLLSWPPYNEPAGTDVLAAYRGSRVIFIGEREGGCTGDDDLHDLLGDGEWVERAQRRPVQWWGMHDVITVYDRKE